MAQKESILNTTMKESGNKKLMVILLLLCLALIITSALAVYFYLQNIKVNKTSQGIVQQEVQKIISKVSHLILLPGGETPTVVTLTDKDINLLKNQQFFSKAHNGDELLIYTNAKEAILYDPVANIIVAVAPVNFGGNPTVQTTTNAKTQP